MPVKQNILNFSCIIPGVGSFHNIFSVIIQAAETKSGINIFDSRKFKMMDQFFKFVNLIICGKKNCGFGLCDAKKLQRTNLR